MEKSPDVLEVAAGNDQDRFMPVGIRLPWWEWVTHALAWLSGVLVVVLTVVVTAEVVMRYFFNRPLGWSVELSEYFMLYLTFLAAPWVMKHDQHVRVDVVAENLPPAAARVLRAVGNLLGLAACLLLTAFAGVLLYDSIITGAMAEKVLRFPRYILVMVVPISSALMAVYFIRMLTQSNRADR